MEKHWRVEGSGKGGILELKRALKYFAGKGWGPEILDPFCTRL